MSASNAFENALALLLFNNTNIANIGDATGLRGSTAAGQYYIALHTADPGEGGSQTTNESGYTNYARVAVARTSAGFTVAGSNISNTSTVQFPTCGATGATHTHFSIGTDPTGAGLIIVSGALTSPQSTSNGNTPAFSAGQLDTDID